MNTLKPRRVVIAIVCAYLIVGGLFLTLARRLPGFPILKLIVNGWDFNFKATADVISHDKGFCYTFAVSRHLLSDREGISALVMYENDAALGPGHSRHDDIRLQGQGKFSHWGSLVFFSASDNSDPRTNGRKYHIEKVRL